MIVGGDVFFVFVPAAVFDLFVIMGLVGEA
jgi:hypothetical protein